MSIYLYNLAVDTLVFGHRCGVGKGYPSEFEIVSQNIRQYIAISEICGTLAGAVSPARRLRPAASVRGIRFHERFQVDLAGGGAKFAQSEFPLDYSVNRNYLPRYPVPAKRGVSPSSRHVGRRMRWTQPLQRRIFWLRTAKSCGPGAATLASIRPACAGSATVTIKAAHRGEHEVSRKTSRAGKAGMSRLYLSNPCALYPMFSTRRCGRSQRPAFPAPSKERANEIARLRRNSRRENESACFHVIARSEATTLLRLLRKLRRAQVRRSASARRRKQSTSQLVALWIASLRSQ
jgi:hypothetical protein